MPRLIPEEPAFADDGGAERRVWEALRDQLPDEAVLLHGLGILSGADEREIDLLVLWPDVGVAVVEVKGGHITRESGAWYQGSGPARHRIDPVAQVQHARHLLTAFVRDHGLDAHRARTAHLVALPHTYVPSDWEIPEAPRGILLDREDLDSAAFLVKRAVEEHGAGSSVLDDAAVEGLVAALAADLPGQLDALTRAAEQEDRAEQLTRDQARMLDTLRAFPRLRVVGGAGSGKTFLALEQARRRVEAGDRVALLCYSRGLGRYLERVTATWRRGQQPAYVGLFHDLPIAWGAARGSDDDSDYWERRLPLALADLAAGRSHADLFDTVVVDEAQDFGDLWWPSLLRCLRDPEAGRLYAFMDDSQRVFARDGSAPIALPPVELDENLRSTKQIAQTFGAFGEDRVRPRGLSGEPVRLVDVPYEEALGAADDALDALLAEGWDPGRVALLTTHHRHPLQQEAVEHGGHAAYWDEFFAADSPFYGHVLNFKGLERSAVVLAVTGFRDVARARSMLYTGMSRARSLLVVVGPRAELEAIGGERVRRRLADARAWVPGE